VIFYIFFYSSGSLRIGGHLPPEKFNLILEIELFDRLTTCFHEKRIPNIHYFLKVNQIVLAKQPYQLGKQTNNACLMVKKNR